jgi:hypothetical protein
MSCDKEKGNHAAVFPKVVHVPALLSEVKQLRVQQVNKSCVSAGVTKLCAAERKDSTQNFQAIGLCLL